MSDVKSTHLPYRAPTIVEIGSALDLTGNYSSPNRDNPLVDKADYHNANPPKITVELDD